MSKMKKFGLWLGQHAKGFAGLAGSAGTLAVALFPSDHRVQEIGGALGVLSTWALVHIVPNAPATQDGAAVLLEASVGEVVPSVVNVMHTHEPELLAALRAVGNALGELVASAAVPTAEPAPDAAPAASEPAATDSAPSVQRVQPVPEVEPDPVIQPAEPAPAPEAAPAPDVEDVPAYIG